MRRRFIGGVLAASAIAAMASGAMSAQTAVEHAECSHLMMLRLPDIKISEAVSVPAATTGAVRVPHCKVTGVIGSEIRFALLLPDAWNRRFLMGGGGGYVGRIDNQAEAAVNEGYATVGTDTGHQGGVTDASWALDNLERQLNFGYLAVHRTAETAKAILRSYYGSAATRSYFSGCSNGGRQALMEAQRYPDDFDGIVAGAPALDFVGIAAQFIKDIQAAFPDARHPAPMFPPETLQSVEKQVLDKCDALDGVKDGVMDDPRRCPIDPAALTGLTDAQQRVIRAIYSETAANGRSIYPAQPVGGEGQRGGWPGWIVGTQPAPVPQGPSLRFAFGTQFFKYFVFGDPEWDYTHYDVGRARTDAKIAAGLLNATNPDLDAFKSKGRKLIVWHGWADPALTPLATVKYHEQVHARDPGAADYFRTFMLPGVLHCAGGAGPDSVNWTAAISEWVENGKAPDRLVARKLVNGEVIRSRPVCPYPQKAAYKGTGSTDEEANFACR